MNVKSTIEVVNTCETIKDALENEYKGCDVDTKNECVTIDGVVYYYDLIKHMDDANLSLYSLTKAEDDVNQTIFALIITTTAEYEGFTDSIIAIDESSEKLTKIADNCKVKYENIYIKPITLGEIIDFDDMSDAIYLPYSNVI